MQERPPSAIVSRLVAAPTGNPQAQPTFIEGMPEQVDPELSRVARATGARLIKKVYALGLLLCSHGGAEMGALSARRLR